MSPREVLTSLQRYATLEGDFGWGVAYHPYNSDLFAPIVWNDSKPQDHKDTRWITMRNIQILVSFLEDRSMHDANGRPRPLILSEQGYHTEKYDQQSQDRQAASIAYAMRKVRAHPLIETFTYHRLIDNVGEGGLRLGLRTLPTAKDRYGEKKRSWKVFQAMGTEHEHRVTRNRPGPQDSAN